MTVVNSTIEYSAKEWDFIESLPKEQQLKIIRGMATPYDYGYID